jgi:hypothetical protein
MSADFDKAIDRAVREMLDVEPPADLRARVMARLPASADAAGGRPAAGFRLPASRWILAPLAAAALMVLVVSLARRSEPLLQTSVVARGPDRYLPPESTPRAAPQPVGQVVPPRVVPSPAPRSRNSGTVVAADFGEPGTTVIEPLKRITPIDAAPITQEIIAPAEIAVRPLNAITELQIAPLTPADRRN